MLAIILLLQALGGAVARHHHGAKRPDRCDGGGHDANDDSVLSILRHRERHRCRPSPARHGTPAVMTANGFQRGQDGGGPAACDGKFHSDHDLVVALSTRWYAGGRRCHGAGIRITSKHSGRSVVARVVDECDSRRGCKNNIVDTSAAVWKALGLDVSIGEAPVTWSDA
ncbi:hypothetical protein BRADI_3g29540v3 [Brachypodium distachyon]|uniref:Ripening-related protein 6 n=2 Tax=Brachypodium distachyon TaxID=15368 RepID=A0A0Q3FGH4_BRADI|nr:hypothetical protein BRADI_3g29540v3 [Brachypodium distachyon]